MGRRSLSGPPEDEYQQRTAWRYPQLRLDIGRHVRIYKEHVSLLEIDDIIGNILGIPPRWVYLVRIHEPLPDTIIPQAYWQRAQSMLRVKGRPRLYGQLLNDPIISANREHDPRVPPADIIPLDYHYRYLTTERPARCMSIIAFSHAQPRNYQPLPSPFLHPTTTRTI